MQTKTINIVLMIAGVAYWLASSGALQNGEAVGLLLAFGLFGLAVLACRDMLMNKMSWWEGVFLAFEAAYVLYVISQEPCVKAFHCIIDGGGEFVGAVGGTYGLIWLVRKLKRLVTSGDPPPPMPFALRVCMLWIVVGVGVLALGAVLLATLIRAAP